MVKALRILQEALSSSRLPLVPPRRECLDRMLIFHRRQLEAVLAEFIDHYNGHRPHRSLDQSSPLAVSTARPPTSCPDATQLRRSDRLGDLIHEYELAA